MQEPPPKRRWITRLDAVFCVTVLLPTLLAALYFGVIASDRYISESRFVVRNPQRANPTGLGALLQGTVFSRSQDDTYSVHDFIKSRDALLELEGKLGMRSRYADQTIDIFNRFPGLDGDASFEAFHRYYQNHVLIEYDTVSSISTLKVRAYTAQDAQRINDLLLQMGERLVNNLNTRSRQDLIQTAESEVRTAEAKAAAAAKALSSFRSGRSVFDPTAQSALQLQTVVRLQDELIAAEAQLAQLRRVSPDNPQVPYLATQIASLKRTIETENAKVLGQGGSLATKSPEFDRLVLERGFAERQLSAALAALDSARNEAARKQLYLERLVQPNLPDVAVEPRRSRGVLMVLAIGLVVWGVASLVLASVREHSD
ncbi:MAG: hypothetical protein ING89_15295 [Rubrivivax sp.]|nr:hypothetical protein [Rubrivivax sp.]